MARSTTYPDPAELLALLTDPAFRREAKKFLDDLARPWAPDDLPTFDEIHTRVGKVPPRQS